MSESNSPPAGPVAPVPPPVPLIVMGVGALVAIALLAQAKEGGNWAIGGSLAGAVLLGSSLLGRLAVWADRSIDARRRQESDRLRAMERIADHLGRIVEQLQESPLETVPQAPERPTTAAEPPALAPVVESVHDRRRAEFRGKLRDGLWEAAEAIALDHAEAGPDDPDELLREYAQARRSRADSLRAELLAAREVQDAIRVIDLREELLLLLPHDERTGLNRDVATWLLLQVQRRCLTGQVAVDVVHLAERVSRAFADTREGASLRASLPTLRRCAGLCPRCGQPYHGEESACPGCLPGFAPGPPGPADEDDGPGPPPSAPPTHEPPPNGHAPASIPPGNLGTGT